MTITQHSKTVDWAAYEKLNLDTPNCIVAASTGGDGSGKSAFWLTAPDPIFVCAFDAYGMNRVGAQFKVKPDGTPKDIRIARYIFNQTAYGDDKKACSAAAVKVWDQFVKDYRMALRNARTVIWDREDGAWEKLRYAQFGDMSAAQKEYGDLNVEYESLIVEAQAAGVNLGLLRGVREKWISKLDPVKGKMVGHNTGELVPDGMKKVPDFVDVTLFHRWDDTQREFITKIGKFTNKDFKGEEFPNLDFASMAVMAYPETTEEDWQ